MNDIDIMRKMLEHVRAEGSIDVRTLKTQFFTLCKGSTTKFADFIAFLAETGAVRLNQETLTVEKIS